MRENCCVIVTISLFLLCAQIFYQKMTEAQQEIKATVTVTTSELNEGNNAAPSPPDDSLRSRSLRSSFRSRRPSSMVGADERRSDVDEQGNAVQKAMSFVKTLANKMTQRAQQRQPLTPPSTVITSFDSDDGSSVVNGAGSPSSRQEMLRTPSIASNLDDPTSFEEVIVKPDGTLTTTKRRLNQSSPQSACSAGAAGGETEELRHLPPEVAIMQPILRFLQLLCENHNQDLQNFLRTQNNKHNYNMVSETLLFLDCICGSTTGGLGLLGLYINDKNVSLVNQTIETLTEYCQGPCHENQNCIATHESNAIDIITALILNDINPLGRSRMDLVLELKNNASKLLLAIME